MAIVWGAWSPNSTTTKRMRLGLELSYSGDPSTGSVTVTKKLYAECWYRIDDSSNSTSISGVGGTFSGSETYDFPNSYSRILVWSGSSVETVVYGSTTTKSAAASVSGIDYIGSSYTVSVSASITLPARPYSTPAAPTSVTNTRASDTRNNIAWMRNATTAAPYTNLYVDRSTDGGGFVQIASLPGSATSYADTTTIADRSYAYRVRASNSAGSSTSATSATTYNTPVAPWWVSATKTGTSDVTLAWSDASRTEDGFEIIRTVDGGTTWTAVGDVGAGVESFADTSAPGGTVQYAVRAKRGSLYSAYTLSNSVTTLQAPAAPTVTAWPVYSPTGTVIRLSWQHNSLDGSEQTSARIEYTRDGGLTVHTQGDGQQYLDIDIDGYVAGDVITAKVQTKGLHADYGPYSALQSTTLADDPQANITTPATDATVVDATPLVVEWTYTDEFAQAAWTLRLLKGGVQVKSWSGTTSTSQSITAEHLDDGTAYTLDLEVRSGTGFTGSATRTFETDFLAPAVPFVEVAQDIAAASVTLSVFEGIDALLPDTEDLQIVRVDPDGAQTVVMDAVASGAAVVDPTPPLNVEVTYRVGARAASGAVAWTEAAVTIVTPYAHFNYGDGYLETARLGGDLAFWGYQRPEQEYYECDGRKYPLMFTGTGRDEAGGVTGELFDDPDAEDAFRALADWGREVIYRSVRGQRYPVGIPGVRLAEGAGPRVTAVQVEMRRTG
jgi:hypothetical protein